MATVTWEQYVCARDLIRAYKSNPNFKECGIEYMDDAERNCYEQALDILYRYSRQMADRNKNHQNQKGI